MCECNELSPKPVAGTSAYVYICSADDVNGTNFTYPANNTQAYIGILSTPFLGTPTFNTVGQWVWFNNPTFMKTYTATSNAQTQIDVSGGYTTYITITATNAGTFVANATAWIQSTVASGQGGVVSFYLYHNGVLIPYAQLSLTVAYADNGYSISLSAPKFTMAVGDTVTLVGHHTNVSPPDAYFYAGTLNVQQVNP